MLSELGCAEGYRVAIHKQGGAALWTWVDGVAELNWGRKLDDYTTATLTVSKADAGAGCCDKLGRTRTLGHEMTLYRDDDPNPIWQGPIIKKTEKRASFTFECRDLLFWLDRRLLAGDYLAATARDTGEILYDLLNPVFPPGPGPRNPGLREYLVLLQSGTRSTTAQLWKDGATLGTVVRDLISAGVDMYTLGRAIYLIPTTLSKTYTPLRFTERDFLDELEVTESGLDATNRAAVLGGSSDTANPNARPIIGIAEDPTGKDYQFWGLVEQISQSENTTDVGVAQGIAAAMRGAGRTPPVDLVVPDGARLSPTAPVSVHQLVPGRPVVVELESYCTPVAGQFVLNEVDVTWAVNSSEQVKVSLAG